MLIMIREESQDREKMVSLDLNLMRREIIEEAVEREKTQGTGMWGEMLTESIGKKNGRGSGKGKENGQERRRGISWSQKQETIPKVPPGEDHGQGHSPDQGQGHVQGHQEELLQDLQGDQPQGHPDDQWDLCHTLQDLTLDHHREDQGRLKEDQGHQLGQGQEHP